MAVKHTLTSRHNTRGVELVTDPASMNHAIHTQAPSEDYENVPPHNLDLGLYTAAFACFMRQLTHHSSREPKIVHTVFGRKIIAVQRNEGEMKQHLA